MQRLYVIVRADLSPAQQAVQAIHAAQEFAAEHRPEFDSWRTSSNTLAMLSVPDEIALRSLWQDAHDRNIPAVLFLEPDIGNQATAVALAPAAKKLCRALPLALDFNPSPD